MNCGSLELSPWYPACLGIPYLLFPHVTEIPIYSVMRGRRSYTILWWLHRCSRGLLQQKDEVSVGLSNICLSHCAFYSISTYSKKHIVTGPSLQTNKAYCLNKSHFIPTFGRNILRLNSISVAIQWLSTPARHDADRK